MRTVTLIYLLAGAPTQAPMPDIPTCQLEMCSLPFVEGVRARCQTEGVIVHHREVCKPTTLPPELEQQMQPTVHDNAQDSRRDV